MTEGEHISAFHVAVELFDALDLALTSGSSSSHLIPARAALDEYRDTVKVYRNIVTCWGEKGSSNGQ